MTESRSTRAGYRRASAGVRTNCYVVVFPGLNGTGLTPSVVLRRHLYPAMARAGIPRVGPTQEKRTFHSLRHRFAKRGTRERRANP
jgi:integrase